MFRKSREILSYSFTHGKKAWFLKHINDPYVKKANQLHYRSRACFKLIEIIEKYPSLILQNKIHGKFTLQEFNQTGNIAINQVLDLGAAPGSWAQIVREILPKGKIVSVDLLEMKPIQGVDFYKADARSTQLHKQLHEKYGKFQLLLSDMAPNFTGDAPETHDLTLELNMLSTLLSLQFGTPQCNLIMKSVQGDKEKHLYNFLSTIFTYVHREKPQSSRSESIEFFYVCEKLRIMKQPENMIQFIKKISQNVGYQLQKFNTKNDAEKQVQKFICK